MALKKTIETIQGLSVNDAYIRIEDVNLNKNEMTFNVKTYVDVDKPCLSEEFFKSVYNIDGNNPIKQGYEYLKTLPEFSGAVDC